MAEQTQLGLLGNLGNQISNLGIPGQLGLLSTGLSLLENRPLGESIRTGLGAFGGLQQINQQQKQREGIEALKKQYANNPKILSLLDSNPTAVMNAITAQAFAPKVDTSTSLMKNIAFLKEQFPDKSIAELIAMTKQPANVVNVNQGETLDNTPFMKDLQKESTKFLNESSNLVGNINSLEDALKTLETSPDITGVLPGLVQNVGGDAFLKLVLPQTANAKAQIESVVQESLKSILGAQFTEKEGERILQRVFDPAVSPQENAKRLKTVLDKLKLGFSTKRRYFEAFSQGKVPDVNLPTLSDFEDFESGSANTSQNTSLISDTDKTALRSKRPASISVQDFEIMLKNLPKEDVERAIELSK
tara:strand:- start:41 stop:1123 length:1083 start_codon:yes stop_codon:yes gene_type:complete